MNSINRRKFIRQSSMGLASAAFLSQLPAPLLANARKHKIDLGVQSWTVRDQLSKDLPGTLQSIASQGYKMIEMCSPKGYKNIGFGPLAEMKTSDLKAAIQDAGLTCKSCHFGSAELLDKTDESIEFAKELGLTTLICSTFWLPKTATLNDYLLAADKLNKAGEKIKQAGLQAAFHNHEFEFATLDGELIYDALMKRFDADLVKMQFQTEVINLGYKAADYFKKYPGRFISAHLSDWTADKKEVPIGKGVIDWEDFFAAARKAGVQYYYVEMAPGTFRESAAFIGSI